ncbi:MAG: hypothetical protein QOI84_995 [Solirubrobacterales bacterium]|jgi:hypothetical protein|nr:hypothetical protein [Solirubrobacterales bacterium]
MLPAAALAEYYVPPGNSAANQYTEAFPTAGGESGGKPGNRGKATPAGTLGTRNANRLEEQGAAGAAAAQVAAETAPVPLVGADRRVSRGGGRKPADSAGGDGGPSVQPNRAEGGQAAAGSGSSAFGEVVGQATGNDGNLGLLLPIAILATIAGSIAYRMRMRDGPTA